jgi:hypothetical protein
LAETQLSEVTGLTTRVEELEEEVRAVVGVGVLRLAMDKQESHLESL